MGMYTEIVIKAQVRRDLPASVEATLQYLFNCEERPDVMPEHDFFQCPRWGAIGNCSSFYHIPWSTSEYRKGYIFSRSDLKNYNGEIELFFDWIRPYLEGYGNVCIGWSWYEEAEAPTLIYLEDK